MVYTLIKGEDKAKCDILWYDNTTKEIVIKNSECIENIPVGTIFKAKIFQKYTEFEPKDWVIDVSGSLALMMLQWGSEKSKPKEFLSLEDAVKQVDQLKAKYVKIK